jgi:hypothetical protein
MIGCYGIKCKTKIQNIISLTNPSDLAAEGTYIFSGVNPYAKASAGFVSAF